MFSSILRMRHEYSSLEQCRHSVSVCFPVFQALTMILKTEKYTNTMLGRDVSIQKRGASL